MHISKFFSKLFQNLLKFIFFLESYSTTSPLILKPLIPKQIPNKSLSVIRWIIIPPKLVHLRNTSIVKKKKSETPWFEILLFFFFFHKSKVFKSLQKIEGKKLNSRGKNLGDGKGQFFTSVNRSWNKWRPAYFDLFPKASASYDDLILASSVLEYIKRQKSLHLPYWFLQDKIL